MRTYFDLHFLCISSQLSYIQVDKHGQCCFYCVFLLICPICFSFYIQCHLRAEWYFSLKIDTNSCQTPINFYPEVVQIFIDCIPLKGQDYLPIFHNWICFICLPAQLHWTPNSGWRKQRHTWESPDIMLADDYSQCYGFFKITLEISTELHLEINFLSFIESGILLSQAFSFRIITNWTNILCTASEKILCYICIHLAPNRRIDRLIGGQKCLHCLELKRESPHNGTVNWHMNRSFT